MKNRMMFVFAAGLVAINAIQRVDAQQNRGDHVIANFEGENPVAGNNTTHKANVTVVDDVPERGGKLAAKTVVDAKVGASGYFGTGFSVPKTDLSSATELSFWIKTDIESVFNFQIHSGKDRASVFQFSTVGSKPRTWTQIMAPIASFTVPPWAKGKADWASVNKWQVTAFGKGPYDGKYIILDHLVSDGKHGATKPPVKNDGPIQRGGSIHLSQAEVPVKPKSPPDGFRSLFDGKSLKGWKAMARIPVPTYPGAPFKWRLEGAALAVAKKNTGRWTIKRWGHRRRTRTAGKRKGSLSGFGGKVWRF